MKTKVLISMFAGTALLVSGGAMAHGNNQALGAAIGAVAGVAIGSQAGGQDGAVVGGIIGAVAGAALTSGHGRYYGGGYGGGYAYAQPAYPAYAPGPVYVQRPPRTVVYVRHPAPRPVYGHGAYGYRGHGDRGWSHGGWQGRDHDRDRGHDGRR
jgi:hypothetical protein